MSDDDKYADLKMLSQEPLLELLTRAQVKLKTKVDLPKQAPAADYLPLLDEEEEHLEILMALAHALPPRQAVWWACLATRHDMDPEAANASHPIKAAENWVYQPGEKNKKVAEKVFLRSAGDDPARLCVMAALYGDGKVNLSDDEKIDAPPGVCGNCVYGALTAAAGLAEEGPEDRALFLIDQGLNIARGGNGKIEKSSADGAGAADRADA